MNSFGLDVNILNSIQSGAKRRKAQEAAVVSFIIYWKSDYFAHDKLPLHLSAHFLLHLRQPGVHEEPLRNLLCLPILLQNASSPYLMLHMIHWKR